MKKLNRSMYFIYSMGVSYAIVDQIYNQWVLYYYKPPANSALPALLSSAYISLALVISRGVDAIMDPLVGYLSDNFNFKFGKRKTFIAIGGIPLGLSTLAFFYAPQDGTGKSIFIYLFIVGSLFFTFYTFVGGPYNALIPDISTTKEERLNLSTYQSVFRLIFTGIAMIVPGLLISKFSDERTGIRVTMGILSLIVVIGIYITVFFLPEKELSKPIKEKVKIKDTLKFIFTKNIIIYFIAFFSFFVGFGILRSLLNYFVEDIMLKGKEVITYISIAMFGFSALGFPITNKMCKKYSYKKIMMIDLVILVIGFLGLLTINGNNSNMSYVYFAIIGLGLSGAAFIFPPAMISEIGVKIVEEKNINAEGLLFGIQGFFLKMSFLLQIAILPYLISLNSPDGKSTVFGIRMSIIIAVIFVLVSLLFYSFYKEEE